ncbi:MAG: mannose-1-phosphate guanylyltransferase [Muribaculaceae bacterium]|nr:mannose-1-phosphate guanylyltransferase [Muribaculaceae bacterium]
MAANRYCVIMCGGAGTRFWPFSRESRPKQFIDFFGTGQTLLQMTVDRVRRLVPEENMILITNEQYADTVREQLPGLSEEHILLEPARRDTAPAVLWAAHHIAARNEDASFVTLPADHVILKELAFQEALRAGFEFVEKGDRLLALGVPAKSPNTSYSYLQKGEPFEFSDSLSHIKTVAEKPGRKMAEIFVRSGEFLWDAGIYLGKAKSVIDAFNRDVPDMASRFDVDADIYSGDSEMEFIADVYPKTSSLPVEYAIMDRVSNSYVLEADLGWSDLSTWYALHSISPKNKDGNVTQNCRSLLYDCKDCIVAAEGEKVIVVSGLNDYIVADTDNALLICPIEAEQRIRNIVNDIRERYGSQFT